jgi:hypothetical protein
MRAHYEAYGVPVIPVNKEKHPNQGLEWKQWQTEALTPAQFECLPWDDAANFAIVTAAQKKGGAR